MNRAHVYNIIQNPFYRKGKKIEMVFFPIKGKIRNNAEKRRNDMLSGSFCTCNNV